METDDQAPDVVPDVAMRTGTGANAEIGEIDSELNEQNAQTLEDTFLRWFDLFNRGEGKTKWTPGFVSWQAAVTAVDALNSELIAREMPQVDADRILLDCMCRSRHMHAPGTQLPPDWISSGVYKLDREHYRVRAPNVSDAPQNWFAVEVDAEVLDAILGSIVTPKPLNPRAGLVPSSEPEAAIQLQPLEPSERTAKLCPDGYGIVLADDGFRAIWYGPPRQSEAEAVADTWRHSTSATTQKGTH